MQQPAVIVKKSGFLAAVASGIFGTIIVTIICASALGLYGMHMADRTVGEIVSQLKDDPQHWLKALPPVLRQQFDDRRDPDYRNSLEITARLPQIEQGGEGMVVVEVANKGSEVVTLLSLRIAIEDEQHIPRESFTLNAASPWVACESCCETDWNGSILPGSTRKFSRFLREAKAGRTPTVEVMDLRVSNHPAKETHTE